MNITNTVSLLFLSFKVSFTSFQFDGCWLSFSLLGPKFFSRKLQSALHDWLNYHTLCSNKHSIARWKLWFLGVCLIWVFWILGTCLGFILSHYPIITAAFCLSDTGRKALCFVIHLWSGAALRDWEQCLKEWFGCWS